MKLFSSLILTICFLSLLHAQSPGDTILVESFNFQDNDRDIVVNFPDDPDLTFEKVILRYTMRCKDGLVSTSDDRNKGCGEWDYSCNTYLVDSTNVEISEQSVASHYVTNFAEDLLQYKTTPVYDYYREEQNIATISQTISENSIALELGEAELNQVLNTDQLVGKTQFLYLAEELISSGLEAGEIASLSMDILESSGSAEHLKIKLKHTALTDLSEEIEIDGFDEVFSNSQELSSNTENRFQFHTPFVWDGSSNMLVEFNFSNLNTELSATSIKGEETSDTKGLLSTTGSEFLLAQNAYLECNDYKGIGGSQNRTIEAWIKGDVVRNGEICSWGANTTGEKWTFRLLSSGEIRVEIAGTGTVSTKKVNDGKWHHVVAVLNGDNASDIQFYIDGELDNNSVTGDAPINTNATDGINLRINRGVNNRYFDGEIDDIRIWDTNLSGETIKNWMRRDITEDHPMYSNLQLSYKFDGSGQQISDHSVHGRDATIIGREYRTSFADGNKLFKDFISTNIRPNISFHQGEYVIDVVNTTVDRPFSKANQIFVSTNTIISGSNDIAIDDQIISADPVQYWLPQEVIYDESSGDIIETRDLTPDGMIEITNLDYIRRFPMYNELVSFVTPYGIGLDFGLEGASWYFDMSDYVQILKGSKRLVMTLGGQLQENMDLDFMFIVGTPPRDVVQFEQIWQGTNRIGNASISDIINDVKFSPTTVQTAADASLFILKSSITGHGASGEFEQNGGVVNHQIYVDGNISYQWDVNQNCSDNPIYPQGGTWVYDRQGWCPGEPTHIEENDLTPLITPGGDVTLDYNTSNPLTSGDYRYHVAHQLVGYGPANHTLDASIVEILVYSKAEGLHFFGYIVYTFILLICKYVSFSVMSFSSMYPKSKFR